MMAMQVETCGIRLWTAGKSELVLKVLFINIYLFIIIYYMNSIKVISFKNINIIDRGAFGIQVDEEYNRHSTLVDTSIAGLWVKGR
jgi:hypothetical protein